MTIEDERRMNLARARNNEEVGADGGAQARAKPAPEGARPKTNPAEAMLMVGTALLFDGAQAGLVGFGAMAGVIPVVGWGIASIAVFSASLIGLCAWLFFYLWFKQRGMTMKTALRKEIVLMLAGGLDVILSILPAWTFAVVINLIFEQLESRVPGLAGIEKAAAGNI